MLWIRWPYIQHHFAYNSTCGHTNYKTKLLLSREVISFLKKIKKGDQMMTLDKRKAM